MLQQKQFRILLIGDNCIDEYQYGDVDRISPEAPVPIFKYQYSIEKPGMAGNVRQNLINLNCHVDFLTGKPNKKVRLIDTKSHYHITRIDYDVKSDPVDLTLCHSDYDAVVVSDYNKGSVSYETIDHLQEKFTCPIFVDTKKKQGDRFNHCFLKINKLEYDHLETANDKLIVTRGSRSVLYFENKNLIEEYQVPNIPVFDVCGAGDTFLAALTYAYLDTTDIDQAIKFAVRASSISIQHFGTYAPTLEEIKCA